MSEGLAKKRYLITGGSSGIGLELARSLIQKGAAVAIVGRNAERLEQAAKEIGAQPIRADVSSPEDADRAVKEATDGLGGLDGLVNNAGIPGRGKIESLDPDRFAAVLSTNLVGPALMMRAALSELEKSGEGVVVNVGSTASLKGYAGGSIYAASKFGLRALSQCWQAELRPRNIRVLQVNPSEVQTPWGGRADDDRVPNKLFAEDVAAAIVGALEVHPRGFVPELTLWATNPWDA